MAFFLRKENFPGIYLYSYVFTNLNKITTLYHKVFDDTEEKEKTQEWECSLANLQSLAKLLRLIEKEVTYSDIFFVIFPLNAALMMRSYM